MHSLFQRLFALLLCVAMLVPATLVPTYATELTDAATINSTESTQTEETDSEKTETQTLAANEDSKTPLAVVYAASDFQNKTSSNGDDFTEGKTVMSNIIAKTGYDSVTGAMFLGDYTVLYTADATSAGIRQVRTVLSEKWDLDDSQVIYVQGNHDLAVDGLDTFGGHKFEHYNAVAL